MTALREAAQHALDILDSEFTSVDGEFCRWCDGRLNAKHNCSLEQTITALKAALAEEAMQRFTDVNQEIEAALAEPVLTTCNCRWDGEVQVQQCTLHEAHVDAIKEWAQRAKFAEKKLAALAEPVQEPVAWVECDGELVWNNREAAIGRNLYTSPPQRLPLTEEEIERLYITAKTPMAFARSIEQAHGITS